MYIVAIFIKTITYFYYPLSFSIHISSMFFLFYHGNNVIILSITLTMIYLTLQSIMLSLNISLLCHVNPNIILFQPNITNLNLFFYYHHKHMKTVTKLIHNLRFGNKGGTV